jgi:hypothetical protein
MSVYFDNLVLKECAVFVNGVSINQNNQTIYENETVQLSVTITPEDATNKKVNWVSGSPGFATVNSNGLITAVKEGYATIFAVTEDGAFEDSVNITILKDYTGIINHKSIAWLVYPNPANNSSITIVFDNIEGETAHLVLCDLNGRELFRKILEPVHGRINETLSLRNFNPSIYVLKLQTKL